MNDRPYRTALVDWLAEHNWDVALTLTFDPNRYRRITSELALKRLRGWANAAAGITQQKIQYAAFAEPSGHDHVHLHALAEAGGALRDAATARRVLEKWRRRHGGAYMAPYTSRKAAAYAAKMADRRPEAWAIEMRRGPGT